MNSTAPNKNFHLLNDYQIKENLQKLIEKTINPQIEYESNRCFQISRDLSQAIKNTMKSLNYQSYKYIVQVILGEENQSENLMMTSRCLWNIQTDHLISLHHSNQKIFCAVTIFALAYS